MQREDQTIQTKQDIPKQLKIILQSSRGECAKTYQQPDAKEVKQGNGGNKTEKPNE